MITRTRRRARPEIPTCSMADIAFLLIVFFLVTTTLHRDKGIGMVLPPAGAATKVPKKNICNVWINAQGEIALQMEPIAFSELRGEVERRLAENEKLIVSLKGDRETDYRVFIDVLDEVKLAGAERISIASPE